MQLTIAPRELRAPMVGHRTGDHSFVRITPPPVGARHLSDMPMSGRDASRGTMTGRDEQAVLRRGTCGDLYQEDAWVYVQAPVKGGHHVNISRYASSLGVVGR